MNNIWVSADQHHNHKNIIKYANRPFKDVEEMDEALIANWNGIVRDGDLVYVLGDFIFNGKRVEEYLSRLRGRKHLIIGGHDDERVIKAKGWEGVDKLLTIKVERQVIVLCHWAMRVWDRSCHGSWHLFAHSHSRLAGLGKSFDVGVDCWNYYPISYEKVREEMGKREIMDGERKW